MIVHLHDFMNFAFSLIPWRKNISVFIVWKRQN